MTLASLSMLSEIHCLDIAVSREFTGYIDQAIPVWFPGHSGRSLNDVNVRAKSRLEHLNAPFHKQDKKQEAIPSRRNVILRHSTVNAVSRASTYSRHLEKSSRDRQQTHVAIEEE